MQHHSVRVVSCRAVPCHVSCGVWGHPGIPTGLLPICRRTCSSCLNRMPCNRHRRSGSIAELRLARTISPYTTVPLRVVSTVPDRYSHSQQMLTTWPRFDKKMVDNPHNSSFHLHSEKIPRWLGLPSALALIFNAKQHFPNTVFNQSVTNTHTFPVFFIGFSKKTSRQHAPRGSLPFVDLYFLVLVSPTGFQRCHMDRRDPFVLGRTKASFVRNVLVEV